jgi:hypothetical protein
LCVFLLRLTLTPKKDFAALEELKYNAFVTKHIAEVRKGVVGETKGWRNKAHIYSLGRT